MFAVVPEDAGERGRSITGAMAMDGSPTATASVDRVWLGIRKRIAVR